MQKRKNKKGYPIWWKGHANKKKKKGYPIWWESWSRLLGPKPFRPKAYRTCVSCLLNVFIKIISDTTSKGTYPCNKMYDILEIVQEGVGAFLIQSISLPIFYILLMKKLQYTLYIIFCSSTCMKTCIFYHRPLFSLVQLIVYNITTKSYFHHV